MLPVLGSLVLPLEPRFLSTIFGLALLVAITPGLIAFGLRIRVQPRQTTQTLVFLAGILSLIPGFIWLAAWFLAESGNSPWTGLEHPLSNGIPPLLTKSEALIFGTTCVSIGTALLAVALVWLRNRTSSRRIIQHASRGR
jgi:cytochrome bd-type quinol oxidase subunit 1